MFRLEIQFYASDSLMQADEHESSTLDDIKENEPEFFRRVTATLKRAEVEFSL